MDRGVHSGEDLEEGESYKEGFTHRGYLSSCDQNVGRNMIGNGSLDETLDGNEK